MKSLNPIKELNVAELVDAISLKVRANYQAFFVNSEMGRFAVEVIDTPRVTICKWKQATLTKFVTRNRLAEIPCKYYVAIPQRWRRFHRTLIEWSVAKELYKILFTEISSLKEPIIGEEIERMSEILAWSYMTYFGSGSKGMLVDEIAAYTAPLSFGRSRSNVKTLIRDRFNNIEKSLNEIKKKYSRFYMDDPHVSDIVYVIMDHLKMEHQISDTVVRARIESAVKNNNKIYDFIDEVYCSLRLEIKTK